MPGIFMCLEGATAYFTDGPQTETDEIVQGGVVGDDPAVWLGILTEGEVDTTSNTLQSAETDQFWAATSVTSCSRSN